MNDGLNGLANEVEALSNDVKTQVSKVLTKCDEIKAKLSEKCEKKFTAATGEVKAKLSKIRGDLQGLTK